MKKNILFMLIFAIITSCDSSEGSLEDSDNNGLNVKRTVEITSGDTQIRGKIGTKIQLEFKEINITAGASGYTWASSDTSIIAVDQNGAVTSVAFGTASVTITSVSDNSISDEVMVDVVDVETYYASDNVQNPTVLAGIGGTLNTSAPNPSPTSVYNSNNVLKFERAKAPFSFLRFISSKKINFGIPDSKISFWVYVEDAGNNGLVSPNDELRVIVREQSGTGATQTATPVQKITSFNKWHEFTFDLKDILKDGIDYYQLYIFCAPADSNNRAIGTIYYIDNVRGPFFE